MGTGGCGLGVPLPPPRPGLDMGVEQLWLCIYWDRPVHGEGSQRSSAVHPHRPRPWSSPGSPRAPLGPQLWDVRSLLCRGLFPTPQPRGTSSAGPGGDTEVTPRPCHAHTTPGTTPEPPAPPFTPHRLLGRSDTNAKATTPPAPAVKLPTLLCLGICTSRFPCPGANIPRRTNPGQLLRVGSALLYPCPSKRMLGWNWDGQQQIADLGNFSYHEMAILYVMRCVL